MNSLIRTTISGKFRITSPLISTFLIIAFSYAACSKDDINDKDSTGFILTSPDIQMDSLLPVEYTCDGESSTLPLSWSGFPYGTRYFALIMHHEASATDIHWYWVLYNIPLSVQRLEKNATGIGLLGNNSVNGIIGYAPPCSKGPGPKRYIYTIYALSDAARLTVPASEVSKEVLLEAIKNITIASATLTLVYSRNK